MQSAERAATAPIRGNSDHLLHSQAGLTVPEALPTRIMPGASRAKTAYTEKITQGHLQKSSMVSDTKELHSNGSAHVFESMAWNKLIEPHGVSRITESRIVQVIRSAEQSF